MNIDLTSKAGSTFSDDNLYIVPSSVESLLFKPRGIWVPVSVHQVNALLNRLIQKEFRGTHMHDKKAASGTASADDRVQISEAAKSQQPEKTNLDQHLLALYSQRGRTRP